MFWKVMWVAMMRSIWEQRNKVIFDNEIVDNEEIFGGVQLKA